MPRIHVIVASNRPGSNGLPIGRWYARQLAQDGTADVTLVDLAEVNLPFLNEPEPADTGRYVHQHTRDWSATVSAADALVVVMPLYNGSFGAALKNAIDYLYAEWRDKPVALVSYSAGPSGGAPAAEMIRPVLTRLSMRVADTTVAIPRVNALIGEDGGFLPPEWLPEAAAAQQEELTGLLTAGAATAPAATA